MNDKDLLKEAKKRVIKRKDFYKHLVVFGVMGILVILLNVLFAFRLRILLIPMVIWGFGLLMQYMIVFGPADSRIFSDEWEDDEIRREYERMARRKKKQEVLFDDDTLDITEPPPEKAGTTPRDWNDKDLV